VRTAAAANFEGYQLFYQALRAGTRRTQIGLCHLPSDTGRAHIFLAAHMCFLAKVKLGKKYISGTPCNMRLLF
jgi:hypothetical protein